MYGLVSCLYQHRTIKGNRWAYLPFRSIMDQLFSTFAYTMSFRSTFFVSTEYMRFLQVIKWFRVHFGIHEHETKFSFTNNLWSLNELNNSWVAVNSNSTGNNWITCYKWTFISTFVLFSDLLFSVCIRLTCFNPLRRNIKILDLLTVLYAFPKVLTRRISWTIKSLFSLRSFPLFSWP